MKKYKIQKVYDYASVVFNYGVKIEMTFLDFSNIYKNKTEKATMIATVDTEGYNIYINMVENNKMNEHAMNLLNSRKYGLLNHNLLEMEFRSVEDGIDYHPEDSIDLETAFKDIILFVRNAEYHS